MPIITSPTANYANTHKIDSITESANDTVTIVISGTGVKPALKAGTPLNIAGLYACDLVGLETQELFSAIVQEDVASTDGSTDQTIVVQRIDVGEYGARNATGLGITELDDLVGKKITCPLALNKQYYVAQIREEKALAYEAPDLDKLAGAESTSVNIGHIKLHVTTIGNGMNMKNITRWDVAYGVTIVDNRQASLAYIPVN